MASEKCFFGCSKKENIIEIGQARILSIIESSRLHGDSYHIDLEVKIKENPEFSLLCHKTCVSTYNSRDHINQSLKRQGARH